MRLVADRRPDALHQAAVAIAYKGAFARGIADVSGHDTQRADYRLALLLVILHGRLAANFGYAFERFLFYGVVTKQQLDVRVCKH